MRFAEPQNLKLLLALPLVFAFFWTAGARRRGLLRRFAEEHALPQLVRPGSPWLQGLKAFLATLALALVVVALARPQAGEEETTLKARGVDFYVCVDVSRSMLALADGEGDRHGPTRLDRAKQMLGSLIRRLSGDRVGIVPFAGEAFVYCPLTLDHAIALDFLGEISPEIMGAQGTNLGAAIDVALDGFTAVEAEAGQAILLLTDGENHGQRAIAAAERASAKNATIFAIGIGDAEPQPIRLPNNSLLKDKAGEVVRSGLDMETLESVAGLTGGRAWRASGGGEAQVEAVYGRLKQLKQAPREEKEFKVRREWFPYVLLASFALLALEWLVPERPKERRAQSSEGRFPQ